MGGLIIYGAAGFVGSTLLTTDAPIASSLTLIDPAPIDSSLVRDACQRGLSVDVRQGRSLRGSADPGDAEVLLVLAGQTDVDQALADPALAFSTNCAIAVEVGEWWRRHPMTRVVYLSSDEVLGVSDQPLAEDAPYRPTQPYAASKAAAEMTLRCYSDTYGLELVVVRSCNLVGSRQRTRKLIPTAVQCLAVGAPVPIFGNGMQRREYLAVEDLCEVLRMAVTGKVAAGIYNCTSGISFAVVEVVEIVARALGVPPRMIYVADRLVHDRTYAMDASLLNSFDWMPSVHPIEAIARTAADLFTIWHRGKEPPDRDAN